MHVLMTLNYVTLSASSQVKRAAHRLNDQLSTVERNITNLKQNTGSVSDEIENICKRLQKSLRDRCDFLKAEVGGFIIPWMVISVHLHSAYWYVS